MEYTFTLKYQLAADDQDPELLVERLADAGCDDALVGTGRAGRLALEFTREAASAVAAMHSALRDVRRGAPSARLIEAIPDLVGLSDVAELAGVTRQNMRKLMLAHPSTFPLPVHEGSASLWHLAELLAWLGDEAGYSIPAEVAEVASAAREVNTTREQLRLPGTVDKRLVALIA